MLLTEEAAVIVASPADEAIDPATQKLIWVLAVGGLAPVLDTAIVNVAPAALGRALQYRWRPASGRSLVPPPVPSAHPPGDHDQITKYGGPTGQATMPTCGRAGDA
jgi:hypothetical protein